MIVYCGISTYMSAASYQYESNVIIKKADYQLNRCVKLTSLVTCITDWFGFNSSYLIHSNSGQFHSNSNLDSPNSFNSIINRRYRELLRICSFT